jgi:hypothetical protein
VDKVIWNLSLSPFDTAYGLKNGMAHHAERTAAHASIAVIARPLLRQMGTHA